MCGIVGYIGNKEATPFLLKGLARLEYRGYDSSGMCVYGKDGLQVYKKQGKVYELEKHLGTVSKLTGTLGIAHTRWATHGVPSDVNAHPHVSNNKKIAVVHNGIVENYESIKNLLQERGFSFSSQTDTEVIANLIQYVQEQEKISFIDAVRIALSKLEGAYGLAIVHEDEKDSLFIARNGSPIVIGVGKDEFFVASDVAALAGNAKNVLYLEDGDTAILKQDGTYTVFDKEEASKEIEAQSIDIDIEQIEKGGFDHFMLKEIFEQPKAIQDSLRGRINVEDGSVTLGGIKEYEKRLVHARKIIFVACGTSWHAALTGKYFIEELSGIAVEVEYASEFRYRNPIVDDRDVVIGISQSGETADTLGALEHAKEKGATILGICNVVGSSLARLTDAGIYTHAGPEISVASTKAFTTQLSVLLLLAAQLGELTGATATEERKKFLSELVSLPDSIGSILEKTDQIQDVAEALAKKEDVFFLGRNVCFPVALEGALKMKEISYIHAEGYPSGEMKHGPLALIESGTPAVFVSSGERQKEKLLGNIEEVSARGAEIIVVAGKNFNSSIGTTLSIPETHDLLVPVTATIVLQLLSYYVAVERGTDVDMPRNLAKSVTVE